jgi:DNA-binding transcriptional MerR regulator
MSAFTVHDASRRSGLSGPTLRYYEEVGLIGPIGRDPSGRHRRYREKDIDTLQALACLRTTPEAAGKRFLAMADGPTISFLEMAQILRQRLGPLAERVPAEEAPGPEPPRLIIHNDRAREELGWSPRPPVTTIVETAESLRDLGLLEKR